MLLRDIERVEVFIASQDAHICCSHLRVRDLVQHSILLHIKKLSSILALSGFIAQRCLRQKPKSGVKGPMTGMNSVQKSDFSARSPNPTSNTSMPFLIFAYAPLQAQTQWKPAATSTTPLRISTIINPLVGRVVAASQERNCRSTIFWPTRCSPSLTDRRRRSSGRCHGFTAWDMGIRGVLERSQSFLDSKTWKLWFEATELVSGLSMLSQ